MLRQNNGTDILRYISAVKTAQTCTLVCGSSCVCEKGQTFHIKCIKSFNN